MRKKLLSALLGTTMVVSMLAGCGSSADTSTSQDTTTQEQKETTAATTEAAATESAAAETSGTGKVYYLNFKPEQADDWKTSIQRRQECRLMLRQQLPVHMNLH